ncbi:hypothetical protein ANANG_G00253640, partial [Anguilla anguilla]
SLSSLPVKAVLFGSVFPRCSCQPALHCWQPGSAPCTLNTSSAAACVVTPSLTGESSGERNPRANQHPLKEVRLRGGVRRCQNSPRSLARPGASRVQFTERRAGCARVALETGNSGINEDLRSLPLMISSPRERESG